jgi:hypothetical protein
MPNLSLAAPVGAVSRSRPLKPAERSPASPPVRPKEATAMHPIVYQDLARARQADLRAAAVRRDPKPRRRIALPRARRRAFALALSSGKR